MKILKMFVMMLISISILIVIPLTADAKATSSGTQNAETGEPMSIMEDIDTTDLASWYVYDHYNTEYWSNPTNWPANAQSQEQAWMMYYGRASENDVMRPASFVMDTNATASQYFAIEDMLPAGEGLGYAQRLREHIYSYIEAGSPAMWFAGYGNSSRADFLFYPTVSSGQKNVKFTVDSRYVNTHCLSGAGFLLNTGIDADGFIHGYILYYKFSSADAVSSVALYKIKDRISPGALHDDTASFTNCSDRLANYCTVVKKVSNIAWSSLMDIDIVISPSAIIVRQGPTGSAKVAIMNVPVKDTGYSGFGPLVQYTGEEHTCDLSSAFKFSNLLMTYQNSVTASAWANAEVEKAVSQGLVPDSLLKEDLTHTISREEFCELAVLLYEKMTGGVILQTDYNPFKDTQNLEILKAFKLHIVSGTTPTTFSPEAMITREQCAKMLFNIIQVYAPWADFDISGIPDFRDQKDIAEYAVQATKYMYYLGVIKGDGNGNFMPKASTSTKNASDYGLATREAAIIMVLRTYNSKIL